MSIAFDNSFARLPERLHAKLAPTPVRAPELIKVNHDLAAELGLDAAFLEGDEGVAMLAGNRVPKEPTLWLRPMRAISSATSCRSSATDAPCFWVR